MTSDHVLYIDCTVLLYVLLSLCQDSKITNLGFRLKLHVWYTLNYLIDYKPTDHVIACTDQSMHLGSHITSKKIKYMNCELRCTLY